MALCRRQATLKRTRKELQMRKVIVFTNLTLDGVMQAPGLPDEDLRGGFQYGGWAAPYAAMSSVTGESMSDAGPLLLGRRTYENFYAYWPNQTDNPFTELLNNTQKYVASRTLREPLAWINSTLLKGDVAEAVAELKAQPGKDFLVMGSGELVQTLMKHGLVDLYVLLIHPLVLGSGRRLFPEGSPYAALQLVETQATDNGVVIVTYRPGDRNDGINYIAIT
jgi:dihydrofolate reductase